MGHPKICSIEQLANTSRQLKKQGKKIVLCHGTFDLLHPGHIRHLERASQIGDVLVVTLTADVYVTKGPNRPVFTEALRAESIAALGCVDYVAICHDVTAVPAIESACPDFYVKGQDYRKSEDDLTGNIELEIRTTESCGGKIFFTDEVVFSSTNLLN
ncbi:MAG: adenylyltransferase/cytidyltransferase family protein, partial [Magnetococcales bacterium]|nr:adenylyltransferase/cytidyltransferase family protein [Magnetococcales bacterium]